MSCSCGERYRLPDGSCAIAHANNGGMSLLEVARVLGVRPQTVLHIERRALKTFGARMAHWRLA